MSHSDSTERIEAVNTTATSMPSLLTISDIASVAKVGYRSVLRWQKQGLLPPRARVPGHPRWRLEDIEAWLHQG